MSIKRTSRSNSFVWFVFSLCFYTAGIATADTPIGVQFDASTLTREGYIGDNWCQTWAADDTVITAMDDGAWTESSGPPVFHSMLYKITGASDSFTKARVEGYPYYDRPGDGWFAYGLVSVDGVLYSTISKTQGSGWAQGPFRGIKLLRSEDSGDTWQRIDKNNQPLYLSNANTSAARTARELLNDDEMFFFEEFAEFGNGKNAYPFGSVAFVQNGQDNSASQDGYVYIYSPEGARAHELLLARVPAANLGLRSAWEYFSGWDNGTAQWSSNIEDRQPNLILPEQNASGEYFGWYSWLPSVVWNPGLQLYIMVNGGTYAGDGLSNSSADYYDSWMHTKTGSLGFWYSETPYGPWQEFFYTDYWTADHPDNLTYQPKLSPKWMSEDGKTMTLIWSDAMKNAQGQSHRVNYLWNQMEINILVEDEPEDTTPPTVIVTSPADGDVIAPVTGFQINGESDDDTSGVNRVLVNLRRTSNSSTHYWNGSDWQDSSVWPVLEPDSDGTWSLDNINLNTKGDYQILLRAYDNQDNHATSSDNPSYNFQVGSAIPEMLSPDPVLTNSTHTFSWTPRLADVSQWWLYLGSSPESSDIFNSQRLESNITSVSVSELPFDGSTVYATLWYKLSGNNSWLTIESTYTAVDSGVEISFTSHNNGDTLSLDSDTFTWTDGASEYWLYLGYSEGARDIFDSNNLNDATSVNVSGLPNDGSVVHARLWYKLNSNSSWLTVDTTFNAADNGNGNGNDIVITSHNNGDTLQPLSDTFSWNDAANEYWLYLGRKQGYRDYFDSGKLSGNLSVVADNLPADGSTVHLRLWYRNTASWLFIDQQYTAGTGAITLTPDPESTTIDQSSHLFSWNADDLGVTHWWLYAGTSAGEHDIADSGNLGSTDSFTVDDIPPGQNLHIRLWYRINSGSWQSQDYVFSTDE